MRLVRLNAFKQTREDRTFIFFFVMDAMADAL
jgi:hypothetical protein